MNPNPDPRHPEACDTTRAGRLTAGGETRPQGSQKRCIRLCTQGLPAKTRPPGGFQGNHSSAYGHVLANKSAADDLEVGQGCGGVV